MDERAFVALHRAISAELRRFAPRRLQCRADADDVVADCFLVAWRRSDEVPDDHEAARRWLFAVAANAVRNHRRSEGRRAQLQLRAASVAQAGSPRIELADDDRALVAAFATLLPGDRRVLLLASSGHLGRSLADALGCSIPAATSRLARARRRLLEATIT